MAREGLAATSAPAANGSPAAADDQNEPWARTRHTVAEGFVYTLGLLPFTEPRRLVRDAVWFPDGTLFERLSRDLPRGISARRSAIGCQPLHVCTGGFALAIRSCTFVPGRLHFDACCCTFVVGRSR
ncbi:MAG: hypothetical protein AAF657_11305 [Acidobacteriota bacterium]